MKIRIVNPAPVGLSPQHAGKEYEAERITNGYLVKVWKSGLQPRVDDRKIQQGHAEIVAEIDYSGMVWAPYMPTP